MSFDRQPADEWQRAVPGTRWFKADLHIHTLDDHAGGRAGLPDGLSGDPTDPEVLARYARRFLKGLVASGVQVAGLTPHSPRAGSGPETSAVWKIVEEWNRGVDDDGVPFREKVFAVFPGFEPNVNDGAKGVHLLLLFDPEIGCDRYLGLYDAIMDGRASWERSALRLTPRNAEEIFLTLDQRQSESSRTGAPWSCLALAPHFQGDHGVFREMRSDVLERFPCRLLGGYELGEDRLPRDFDPGRKPGKFLLPFMEAHRQAFFHASGAYDIPELGRRYTWMKLASPRIEALRQAFIARDSRMRIGFERGEDGSLRPASDPPDVTLNARPWLKEVEVRGAASFFGGGNGGTRVRFNPDLTCIIGGSMTGKSTLLDGLRVHVEAPLPNDESICEQVEARGRDVFGAGSPEVRLDCPGSDPSAPDYERWPAQFFAQSELQRLSLDVSAVEDILAKLIPSETRGIEVRSQGLGALDGRLRDLAKQLAKLDEDLAEAEQAHERASSAGEALAAFSEAGVEGLHRAGRDRQRWTDLKRDAEAIRLDVGQVAQSIGALDVPELDDKLAEFLGSEGVDLRQLDLARRWSRIEERNRAVGQEMSAWIDDLIRIVGSLEQNQERLRVAVERALAERGLDAAKLREIQELNRQAGLLPSYEANLNETREHLAVSEASFDRLQGERQQLVEAQRKAFDRVMSEVEREFDGRIRSRRIDNGVAGPLDAFLRALKQKGITRWWNDLAVERKPSPGKLAELFDRETSRRRYWRRAFDGSGASEESSTESPPDLLVSPLGEVGMSDAVQNTFHESLTRAKKWELAALRCPDRYFLDLRMDDGSYRRLDELSGGQRVSVLLSLLLETEDNRPLVIDQPEDELDNRFLFDTVLPALKKLKGRRQVIVATHSPNIVVNGDADMVIQLEASANRGRAACSGAIEEAAVRDAIVRTVDGGEEAFRLRRRKYGF